MISPGPAIAAAKKRRLQEEEEEMVTYNNEDLAGWEMLEKFDDKRIRFRRHIKNRYNDQFLDIDPYRTQYGLREESIIIIVALLSALILGIVFMITRFY